MDRTEALQATRNGAIAACISAVLTLGLAVLARTSGATGVPQLWNDPTIFIDIGLMLALAYGISRRSRAAAVGMVLYFVVSKIVMTIEFGRFPGSVMSLVFLYFYARAIQGAFVFHRLEKAENPNYLPVARWVPWVTAPLGIVVAALLVLGLLSMTGVTPAGVVQAGHQVTQKHRSELTAASIIERDEEIDYFYADGLTSVLEGGVLLTSGRVILYYPENGELQVFALYFDEIEAMALVEPGNYLADAVYRVEGHAGAWMQIPLATDRRGDVRFIELLRARVGAARP